MKCRKKVKWKLVLSDDLSVYLKMCSLPPSASVALSLSISLSLPPSLYSSPDLLLSLFFFFFFPVGCLTSCQF